MIPILLDRAVLYHTRKGLRGDCDCDYCRVKQWATWELGTMGETFIPHLTPTLCLKNCPDLVQREDGYYHRCIECDEWGILLGIARREGRLSWRAELYKAKLAMCKEELVREGHLTRRFQIDQETYNSRECDNRRTDPEWDRYAG